MRLLADCAVRLSEEVIGLAVLVVGNILAIDGVTALAAPLAAFDPLFLILVSGLPLFFATTGRRISWIEGSAFLAAYASYMAYLVAA